MIARIVRRLVVPLVAFRRRRDDHAVFWAVSGRHYGTFAPGLAQQLGWSVRRAEASLDRLAASGQITCTELGERRRYQMKVGR